jgi:hypothetical protein
MASVPSTRDWEIAIVLKQSTLIGGARANPEMARTSGKTVAPLRPV